MSVLLDSRKCYLPDNFKKLSDLVAKPTACQEAANEKGSGAVRTSTMTVMRSDNKGVDRKSIKKLINTGTEKAQKLSYLLRIS